MKSQWVFNCSFGLSQDTCRRYERDDDSRGAHQNFQGCASCLWRLPASVETDEAEWAWLMTSVITNR